MKKSLKKVSFGMAILGLGVVALGAAEGCTVTVTPNSCDIQTSSGGQCGVGESYWLCQNGDSPVTSGTCVAGTAAGSYCCAANVAVDSGLPDTSPVDSGGGNACNSCLFGQCSGQWSVCAQQADCAAIYTCATACASGDQSCVNNCFKAKPNGQAAYLALASCDLAAECGSCKTTCATPASTCAVPDAGGTDAGSTVNSCASCTSSKCATEKTACAPGSDCDGYTQCIAICKDAACLDACGLAHQAGLKASEALGTCVSNKCKADCGL